MKEANKILLNCELPGQLLFKSEELNDYDFVLYHMFVKNKMYREYFSQVMKEGKRMTILDNSAYEFFRDGGRFYATEFIEIVEKYNPTYFIVPDVLMDCNSTLKNFEAWKDILPTHKRMVVPQGKSFKEWLSCYTTMLDQGGFDYIGIPFHNDFFWDIGTAVYSIAKSFLGSTSQKWTSDMAYVQGRAFLLQYLVKEDLIDYNKKYHLLGSHHPVELSWIVKENHSGRFDWVSSMDTSYPVTKGIMRKDLEEGAKESLGIDHYFERLLDTEVMECIIKNIEKFHGYRNY